MCKRVQATMIRCRWRWSTAHSLLVGGTCRHTTLGAPHLPASSSFAAALAPASDSSAASRSAWVCGGVRGVAMEAKRQEARPPGR